MLKSSIIVFLTGVTVWLCQTFPNAVDDPQTGLIMRLPDEIPEHVGYKREVSEEEKHWLPSDTEMLKRTYYPQNVNTKEEAINQSIAVTLIQSGSDQRSLHRPEVFLDGQGWTIVDQPVVKLEVNGKVLKVKDL